jgi:hypothetical protein
MKRYLVRFETMLCGALAITTVSTIGILLHALFEMQIVA